MSVKLTSSLTPWAPGGWVSPYFMNRGYDLGSPCFNTCPRYKLFHRFLPWGTCQHCSGDSGNISDAVPPCFPSLALHSPSHGSSGYVSPNTARALLPLWICRRSSLKDACALLLLVTKKKTLLSLMWFLMWLVAIQFSKKQITREQEKLIYCWDGLQWLLFTAGQCRTI